MLSATLDFLFLAEHRQQNLMGEEVTLLTLTTCVMVPTTEQLNKPMLTALNQVNMCTV